MISITSVEIFFFSCMMCISLSVTITPGSLRIRPSCLYLLSIRIKLSRLCLDTSISIVPHVLVCTLWNVYSQYTTHAKQLQCSVQHYIQNFKALTILVSPWAPLVYCVLNCLHSHRGYVATKPFKTAVSIARFDKTKKPTWHWMRDQLSATDIEGTGCKLLAHVYL
jgi:hypothetical protein